MTNRDIATVFGDPYSKSCPKVLGDVHGFLLSTLEAFLIENKEPTLLVLGSGGQVLPFSCKYTKDGKLGDSNRDRIKRIIKNGRIISLDYLLEESKYGLERGVKTLEAMGFFDNGYFTNAGFNLEGIVKPEELSKGSICFLLNNLRDKLRLTPNSIDAVDATLSIHHASITREELARIYKEIFRALKPGGFVHLGEGNVDMNYSEDKLVKIGQDISSILNSDVLVTDEREKSTEYVVNAFFENGGKHESLPVITRQEAENKKNYASVKITEDGLVVLRANNPNELIITKDLAYKVRDEMKNRGYKQMFVFDDSLTLPLIDPEMPEDVRGQIEPVNRYYEAIKNKVMKGYSGIDDELVAQIIKGIDFESGNARRGTVEYYMGEEQIVRTLREVGFIDIRVTHHEEEPFYNITARKPVKKYQPARSHTGNQTTISQAA